jgi:uncharacterized membrane protein HdeD (DUF308 family)
MACDSEAAYCAAKNKVEGVKAQLRDAKWPFLYVLVQALAMLALFFIPEAFFYTALAALIGLVLFVLFLGVRSVYRFIQAVRCVHKWERKNA